MPKAQETVLEINLDHLSHNFNYLRSRLQSNTAFLAVVKAFAYGSDAEKIPLFLQDLGVDYFAVAYAHEGMALRNVGITIPILVLHPQPINFKSIISNCLEPSLYSAKVLNAFIKMAKEEGQKDYPVHIKFNTGLNRLGFWENDVDYILEKIQSQNAVKIKSLFSHLAASEDLNEKAFSESQIKMFMQASKDISNGLGYTPMQHMCNTSGILNYPEAHFDMVRSGIGLYGFGNSAKENKNLKPIAALKSVISQIHRIEKGESVGYNRAYKASHDETTATIPLGHADGIGRQYGNGKGYVYINGLKAPIIGNVCMDMIMVNISNIECKEGDEVIIFDQTHSAEDLAAATNSISYELITAISPRVKRYFIGD